MQLNKIVKSLALALPVLALAACSSDQATDQSAATQTTNGGQSTVVTTPVDNATSGMTEMEQKEQMLRQEQTVFFAFDNSEISADYQAMLGAHAAYLRDNTNVKAVIEGHADERGTPEYNIALGERRAKAVSQYLQGLGVQASQLSIVSYGEEKPLVMGHTASDYAKNRRAVIVY
ncbi:peptidoglycan-associated lipoprotein Pal [Vibrio sp. SS-MA-C1-2]|uniref:peptidoglycan-associated lipoprotein Pal n=1 Tax=Vibrio sp. SS-MA-C1-2 TaxID=2908646 RepID=UPI001F2914C4|nr:peptidoglycan-associated lipoprotein Pal [Vibrio sp. SS-MA-C1-2]UJF18619.1 peptidoglycan-associated lipoprotein Pal [Vibrio sp. SS-MA-C1-2]